MTIFTHLIGKLRSDAEKLGMDALGAEGRAVLAAIDAWGAQPGRAGVACYADVRDALVNLRLKAGDGMGAALHAFDQNAEALHHTLYGKPQGLR